MSRPGAIGYLRSDVSGARQSWDEGQIRSLATRLGYDLRKTVVFSANTDRPENRLRLIVDRLDVAAVVVPSIEHFEGRRIPDGLSAVADVVTISPECTYTRGESSHIHKRQGQ